MSTKNKVYQYNISNISINSKLISWEDHAIWTSGISQIWMGRIPAKPFPKEILILSLFLALSGQHIVGMAAMLALLAAGTAIWLYYNRSGKTEKLVHLKLHSGDIISFTASDEASVSQLYDALKGMADGANQAEIIFDMDGTMIENAEAEEEVKEEVMEKSLINDDQIITNIAGKSTFQEPLRSDIQKLYTSYSEKADANSEVIALINDIVRFSVSGDRANLKKSFETFITLGMIADCNELGLHALLQEIKNVIY